VNPASAWTGDELLVWGGSDDRGAFFDDGAAYDPRADVWRTLPGAPVSARVPLSVWTGQEFIVWGTAVRVDDRPRDGAAYDPKANSWRTIAKAPIELTDATATWTGREMIVFGAALHGGNFPESKTAIGAAYDPRTDRWRRLPASTLSPQASTAAWSGRELIAWDYLNGTQAYDPAGNKWRNLTTVPLDAGECHPKSTSIGRYVFGDYCGSMVAYDPADDQWHDLSRRELVGWGLELVATDTVVLLLGRNVNTGEERMFAYRPPTW
jgi:N-acetylneuraminic acid mutarotase